MTSAEVPIRAGNLCEASRSVQCDARTLTPRLGQAPSAFLEDVAPLSIRWQMPRVALHTFPQKMS